MHKLTSDTASDLARKLFPVLPHDAGRRHVGVRNRAFCLEIGRLAVRSLHDELTLYPKPGLVSPVDSGSHDDMTAETFMRSLFALRTYFISITGAGIDGAPFATLKRLGMNAEAKMLAATGGINTHRGAIFCLGMLCAAVGYAHARGIALSAHAIRAVLLARWGDALAAHTQAVGNSHGLQAAARHAIGGAREEVAGGLPSVFDIALPRLRQTLADRRDWESARIDAMFALMAYISDTNIYHRGGCAGARTVRTRAQWFLSAGGTAHPAWKDHALACHRLFVSQRLSPGGAADLLAATCFVHEVVQRF
jgi:triphosphoribosyl-dephospho-CoA synthase